MARVGEARLCGEGAALQRLPSRRTWAWFGGSAAAVWTWVWKLYVSFATAPLLPLRYTCNRPAAPRGQIVTTAQVTRQTRYSNTLVC